MRNAVFFVGGHLGKGSRKSVGHEQRVVTESLASDCVVDDAPLDDALEPVFLPAEQQRDDGAEPCATVGNPFQVVEQQFVVLNKIVAVGGVSGRMDAGCTAQSRNLQTGVVGETIQSRAVVKVVRLLRGVAFERVAGLGNLLRNAAVARRQELEAVAQYGLHFGEFVGVVRGEKYFHNSQ